MANDCFALPAGVSWTPVDEALQSLRDRLQVVVGTEMVPSLSAIGRTLAEDVRAIRNSPPYSNSAVDGYGFAFSVIEKAADGLPLHNDRSAAGSPFLGTVKAGKIIRILTGAVVPEGVDTVVMEEDVLLESGHVKFSNGLKKGANIRSMGEDCLFGQLVLTKQHRLLPQDLALLASVGVEHVEVYRPLRVGVLSTGDELRQLGEDISPFQIYDANRPMLFGLIAGWGMQPVDLGHIRDDADKVRKAFDDGAKQADVIITSGGVSVGDEDHVSKVLQQDGALDTWRIAMKPGRPLALGVWNGVPVFGLPGNPVAAFICAIVFAKPALDKMSGSGWSKPRATIAKAAFTKSKKSGRREYLRAKLRDDGFVEVYSSEGSGRVSGLSWATGLVELDDEARDIWDGGAVKYYPFSEFGI